MDDVLNVLIPESVANLQLPDPGLVNLYEGLDNRILWVDGEIDISLLEITKKVMMWNMQDRDIPIKDRIPIKVFIFSPGGCLAETMHACTIFSMSKTPVWTVNMGIAHSGGFMLLISGHTRFALPYSRAMMHRGSGGAVGTFGQAEDAMKDYNSQISDMRDFILDHTKISSATYSRRKDRDSYFSAKEQVQYGIVDHIVESLDEII